MKGVLYGVGVGPGDPELLTLKAARLIRECDEIAVPHKEKDKCFALRIASGAVPEIDEKPILEIDMPMTRDMAVRERAYEAGAAKLAAALDEGKTVVFLTLGDPTVYSTYGYLHARLAELGYDARLVQGGSKGQEAQQREGCDKDFFHCLILCLIGTNIEKKRRRPQISPRTPTIQTLINLKHRLYFLTS